MSSPGRTVEEEDDPAVVLAGIALLVDRQLEHLRSVLETGGAIQDDDPLVQHVRRSATEVAGRCAHMARSPATGGQSEVARPLASMSALAVWALESRLRWQAGDVDRPAPLADVVIVLGEAVADRFRSLVQSMNEGGPSARATNVPVELYVRHLEHRDLDLGNLHVTVLWLAMALKVSEAASAWSAVTSMPQVDCAPGQA